jgi:hypothetical protein
MDAGRQIFNKYDKNQQLNASIDVNSRLRIRRFTAVTGGRIPLRTPIKSIGYGIFGTRRIRLYGNNTAKTLLERGGLRWSFWRAGTTREVIIQSFGGSQNRRPTLR